MNASNQNRVFVGLPVDSAYEVGFVESLYAAIALDPDGSEGMASRPHVLPYRVTNQARNLLVHKMLNGNWTHLLMLDSDMVFPAGLLGKLLSHNVDIVGGFYLRKVRGNLPTMMRLDDNGQPMSHWPEQRLEQVDGIGTGAILVRRNVFETLDPPWFYYRPVDHKHNTHKVEQVSEDYVFCENARAAGYTIHVDGSAICGHVGPFVVWPHMSDGDHGVARIHPFEPQTEDLIYDV